MIDADRESTALTDTLITLFKGPYTSVNQLKQYVINGLKFRSSNVEANRKMQNSGVSVANEGGIMYYSVLTDIIELNYSGNIRHVLFKCTWVDDQNRKGYKTDEFGFPMVNFTHSIHGGEEMVHEPYVLASQVTQVFYVEDKRPKIGMSSLKRKPEMCLMWVLGPIVMRMTQMSFLRTFCTLSLVMMLVGMTFVGVEMMWRE